MGVIRSGYQVKCCITERHTESELLQMKGKLITRLYNVILHWCLTVAGFVTISEVFRGIQSQLQGKEQGSCLSN